MPSQFDTLPGGTEWVRCALQVNPFAYLQANGKMREELPSEEVYNREVIAALLDAGVQAIGITDHWSVETGERLRVDASAAGLTVFPGFEATSSEGVHLLMLFDPSVSSSAMTRRLGECGIGEDVRGSVTCNLGVVELLQRAKSWDAVAVAPHVTTSAGLLQQLNGQAAVNAWTSSALHAVGRGGATLSQGHRAILENKDATYRRRNKVAILAAADVSSPADAAKPGSSCWIKLSSRTAGGLDLAFRTPDTRVTLEDPNREEHPRILGIAWRGGFLDGTTIRLNSSLNVLIGGRGTGKSTVLESIRYCLDSRPLTKRSIEEHDAMVRQVLGAGTEVVLEFEVRTPASAVYTVTRVFGEKPVIRDQTGRVLRSQPLDVLGEIAIYGQRELADLARDGEQLTRLLEMFVPSDHVTVDASRGVEALRESRNGIVTKLAQIDELEEAASRLPVVLERLQRFEEAGVGERLSAQTEVKQEEEYLDRTRDALASAPEVDTSAVQVGLPHPLAASPRDALLQDAGTAIAAYNAVVQTAAAAIAEARTRATEALAAVRTRWSAETAKVTHGLDDALRALQPEGIDGNEYLSLKREEQRLRGFPDQLRQAREDLLRLQGERADLLATSSEERAARIRTLKSGARQVRKALPSTVQADLQDGTDRSTLTKIVRELGGRLDTVRSAIESADGLSPSTFASICRGGAARIRDAFPTITARQAEDLAAAGENVFMTMEELDLPLSTTLQLNVGPKDSPIWRSLDHLSTGQRATALLLLLMKRGTGPLIIDQPEDDLDNRFINADIVPRLREKNGRQLLFSSHNANIPVLGDADQLVVLTASDNGTEVTGAVADGGLGSIDHPELERWVEELLEGGREAFNSRRYMYGF